MNQPVRCPDHGCFYEEGKLCPACLEEYGDPGCTDHGSEYMNDGLCAACYSISRKEEFTND